MHGPDALRFPLALPSPVPPHPVDAMLTPARAHLYRQVLARRSARLVIVVEDCHDPHNATAIIRTCDAFGLHRVAVTTARNGFKINQKISQGSHHYIDLRVFPDIGAAYAGLRALGYRILVSDLAAKATVGPERLRPMLAEQPLALVFGNEGDGVSEAARAGADGCFLIPMAGFPQSLNLSVSVAVTVYALRQEALSADLPGDLSAAEQCACYDAWVRGHKGAAAEAMMRAMVGRHGEELQEFRGARPVREA
jgi:tRNA (guanosine-2'-O-)-methyltransferase